MPTYSQGANPVLPIGNNALVGNFQAVFSPSAPAGTEITVSIPLPTSPQPNGLYWIGVINPSGLGTTITVQAINVCQMADSNSYQIDAGAALTVNSGNSNSKIVQGFLLGDTNGEITVTLTDVSTNGGTVLIQVREV